MKLEDPGINHFHAVFYHLMVMRITDLSRAVASVNWLKTSSEGLERKEVNLDPRLRDARGARDVYTGVNISQSSLRR